MHFSARLERRNNRNGGLHGDEARKYRSSFKLAGREEKSCFDSINRSKLQNFSKILEAAETQITLGELPVGSRLLVRSKKDWRVAVLSRFTEEKATLIVCSPSGRTYRLYRNLEVEIIFDGSVPILKIEPEENWRENFTKYDFRW